MSVMTFNKNHINTNKNKNKAMKPSYLHILFLLLGTLAPSKGQDNNNTNTTINTTSLNTNTSSPLMSNNTSSPMSTPSTLPPSQTPSDILNEISEYYLDKSNGPLIPPWGEPAFGYNLDFMSPYYSGFANFEDIRHYGWSWLPTFQKKSAPFCYEREPRPFWTVFPISSGNPETCYSIESQCDALGGTIFNNILCIEDPAKPFTVVGPVCWNETCYNQKTFAACKAAGGQFIGGPYDSIFNASQYYEDLFLQNFSAIYQAYWENMPSSEGAWCAVPGKHTLVGPVCYGQECFQKEMSAVCNTTLQGTTFADIFCLVDDAYTVVGPICTPNSINGTHNESVCYPEETLKVCQEMEGTSIGDIFCVVKGNYSVLGPFCSMDRNVNVVKNISVETVCFDASNACLSLGGTPLGNGAFCVLKGEYTYVRPDGPCCTLYVAGVDSRCKEYGGTDIVSQPSDGTNYDYGCIFQGKYSTVGPMRWGDSGSTSFKGDEIGGNIDEYKISQSIISGYVVLEGKYSVYGPSCFGESCYLSGSGCLNAGGASFGGVFCAVADDGTGKIIKADTTFNDDIADTFVTTNPTSNHDSAGTSVTTNPTSNHDSTGTITKTNTTFNDDSKGTAMKKNTTSNAMYNNINSKSVTYMLHLLVSLRLIWGSI